MYTMKIREGVPEKTGAREYLRRSWRDILNAFTFGPNTGSERVLLSRDREGVGACWFGHVGLGSRCFQLLCRRKRHHHGAKIEFVSMERVAKSLARMKLSDAISIEDLARAAWPAAVGKRIASHASAKSLVRDSLIVEVEDAVWRKNLFQLRFQILGKLSEILGSGVVQDVEFRVPTQRRPPQPAQRLNESNSTDEAERIDDPGMRIVYKQARKKASA
jgi:hypothetical protein